MQPVRSLRLNTPKLLCAPVLAAVGFALFARTASADEPVRFERDVMAVLLKAGCNLARATAISTARVVFGCRCAAKIRPPITRHCCGKSISAASI